MADLIDRDATIKLFCDDCCKRRGVTEMCGDDDKCQDIDVLKSIPAVNRWIPCSERLPEDFSWCLVCMADGFIRLGRWNAKYDDAGAWQVLMQNGDKMYRIKTVPHWMPLPEPPKE